MGGEFPGWEGSSWNERGVPGIALNTANCRAYVARTLTRLHGKMQHCILHFSCSLLVPFYFGHIGSSILSTLPLRVRCGLLVNSPIAADPCRSQRGQNVEPFLASFLSSTFESTKRKPPPRWVETFLSVCSDTAETRFPVVRSPRFKVSLDCPTLGKRQDLAKKTQCLPSIFTGELGRCICRNVQCLHSRWTRWPTEATSNTYFPGVVCSSAIKRMCKKSKVLHWYCAFSVWICSKAHYERSQWLQCVSPGRKVFLNKKAALIPNLNTASLMQCFLNRSILTQNCMEEWKGGLKVLQLSFDWPDALPTFDHDCSLSNDIIIRSGVELQLMFLCSSRNTFDTDGGPGYAMKQVFAQSAWEFESFETHRDGKDVSNVMCDPNQHSSSLAWFTGQLLSQAKKELVSAMLKRVDSWEERKKALWHFPNFYLAPDRTSVRPHRRRSLFFQNETAMGCFDPFLPVMLRICMIGYTPFLSSILSVSVQLLVFFVLPPPPFCAWSANAMLTPVITLVLQMWAAKTGRHKQW